MKIYKIIKLFKLVVLQRTKENCRQDYRCSNKEEEIYFIFFCTYKVHKVKIE